MKPQLGVRVLLYCLFNLVARWGWMVNATHRQFYPWESNLVPIAYGAPRADLDWYGIFASTRIRPPDRPARS